MSTPAILLIFVICASIAYYFGVARVAREYDPLKANLKWSTVWRKWKELLREQ